MRKVMKVVLLGLFFFSFSPVYAEEYGGTYENQAIVSFYSDDTDANLDESLTDNTKRFPKTGSEYSLLGLCGSMIFIITAFAYRRRKIGPKEENID
ncbi:hypothetical protein G8C15_17305 [Enterococcus casseliflavus]|nr:hypothetical protein [Enterococcus casseliflavus]MBF0015416.1 hypothetical protein [Enterococcus casseliflavus]